MTEYTQLENGMIRADNRPIQNTMSYIAHNKDAHEARNDYLLALLEVAKLHFSIIAEGESLEGYPMACHHCNVLYPCRTIEIIEKVLS